MRNSSLKIKAFTLSEMIVVLLVTLIVVGLAFSMLRFVQKQILGISNNYEKNTEVNLLRQALSIDFATYANIYFDDATRTLRCDSEARYVNYIFQEDWIVREHDTFNLKLKYKAFYLEGLETTSGDIDAMELITTKERGEKIIFVHHQNAANEYMY